MAIESWKPVDLSPSHAYLLMLVIEEPGMQPGSIANQLQLTPSTVTRLLEKLEHKKLIVRTTDGKQTNVYPSPKAKALLADLKRCVKNFSQTCNKALGKEESDKIVATLYSVADQLEV